MGIAVPVRWSLRLVEIVHPTPEKELIVYLQATSADLAMEFHEVTPIVIAFMGEAVDLPGHPDEYKQDKKRAGSDAPLSDWLKEQEKQYLAQKLAVSQGNIALTARSCGIGIRTLSRKMREYGLDKKSFKQKEPVAETRP
jgi:DNA-binding NtrC family response regulator